MPGALDKETTPRAQKGHSANARWKNGEPGWQDQWGGKTKDEIAASKKTKSVSVAHNSSGGR